MAQPRRIKTLPDGSRDLISELPREVKDRILECLPTRDAARMALLSTHWNDAWLQHGRLAFDSDFFHSVEQCYEDEEGSNPVNIINNILFFRAGPVKKFILRLSSDDPRPEESDFKRTIKQLIVEGSFIDLPVNAVADVKERILELLSTRDAARTALLSTHWNHVWLRHGRLVFDADFLQCVSSKGKADKVIALVNIIDNILLLHDGPIKKFVLYIYETDLKPQRFYLHYLGTFGHFPRIPDRTQAAHAATKHHSSALRAGQFWRRLEWVNTPKFCHLPLPAALL
nr:F-box/FBD/LRR-repeat protein At1g13570-like [Ipomoea batatas]